MNHKTTEIHLNGVRLSEFLFNAYSAASLGIPVPFISGDSGICTFAKELIPNITAVEAVTGFGLGSYSRHPEIVCEEIESKAREALLGDWRNCSLDLPKSFTITIKFREHQNAYFISFYLGIKQKDAYTLEYNADSWYEILRMVHFVLDK